MEKEPFVEEGPPLINLGIVAEGEKKRAVETKAELITLAERPIEMPVGDQTVVVKPFTLDKAIYFQDLYFETIAKLQGSLKGIAAVDGEDVGQIITRAASARKETYEAALLLGALILEETCEDKDIDLNNLAFPPVKLRKKITPMQLAYIISTGLELCQSNILEKKILGGNG